MSQGSSNSYGQFVSLNSYCSGGY